MALSQDPVHTLTKIEVEKSTPDPELQPLFSLLDDPDVRISEAVIERLRSKGDVILNHLLDFVDRTDDELAGDRASTLVRELNEERLAKEFSVLNKRLDWGDPRALEDGAFLVARYGYPRLNIEHYRFELSALAGMLRDRIAGVHSPLEVLAITNDFFFEKQKFRGNQSAFLEADNSYLNRVLDRKMGIPISLAVLYLLIAKMRVGLPFAGASAPGHFLIRYDGALEEPLFIDAFNGGVVLRRRDIKRFLDASKMKYKDIFLEPAEDRTIILRMIRNLIMVFGEQHDITAQRAFKRFLRILIPQTVVTPDDVYLEDVGD